MSDDNPSQFAYELSLALAWSTGAHPHTCYANAWHVCSALTKHQEICLVEGWMVLEQCSQVTLIEHGWCQWGTLIVDPSLVLLLDRDRCQAAQYFSGIQRPQTELQTLTCADLPVVHSCGRFGDDGLAHPEYRAAYHRAHHHALQRGTASALPKPLVIQPSIASPAEGERFHLVVHIASTQNFRDGTKKPKEDAYVEAKKPPEKALLDAKLNAGDHASTRECMEGPVGRTGERGILERCGTERKIQ